MSGELVYVIDDDINVVRAIEWLLKSVNLKTHSFTNPAEFLASYDNLNTNCCVIMDVRMPSMSGMEVLKIMQESKRMLPTIVITGYGDIPMAVQAIKYGAIDYISKPYNEQILLELIQNALSKNMPMTQSVPLEETAKLYMTLSDREKQVLSLIVEGVLNKQISATLGIAVSTVEMHRSRILQKMHAVNTAQLIKKVVLLKL